MSCWRGWVDQWIQKKKSKKNPPVSSVEGITKRKGSRNLGARAFADLGLFDWYCFRAWTSCSLTAGIWTNSGGKRKETQILSSCLKFLWSIFILFTIYKYIYICIFRYIWFFLCLHIYMYWPATAKLIQKMALFFLINLESTTELVHKFWIVKLPSWFEGDEGHGVV